jgi:uncharacterized protein (TIGR00266 family)
MKSYEILYRGSYATLKVDLAQGETIKSESDAMLAMDPTIDVEGKAQGGLLKGLGRMLTGESFFQQTLTANRGDGTVLLAPGNLGELECIEMNGEEWILQKEGFFASDESIETKTHTQSLGKALFSGEGLFILKASGTGKLFISSFGAIHKVTLAAGQEYIVDNGHLVAWNGTMNYKIEKASKSGLLSSWKSGEGFVTRFTGPGTIYIQTRNMSSFVGILSALLPTK